MSCSQVRRELLEHLAFSEELGPGSGPHLAHLEGCADCRVEMGIDRELVGRLRLALRDRVAGGAPPGTSWEFVRRRTVDRPVRPWTARVPQWRGMVSAAAAAGIMIFAVATESPTRILPGNQSPFVASAPRRAVPPVEDAAGMLAQAKTDAAPLADRPLPGWPKERQMSGEAATNDADPAITGRMR